MKIVVARKVCGSKQKAEGADPAKKRYHLLYPAQCGYDRTKWGNRAAGA